MHPSFSGPYPVPGVQLVKQRRDRSGGVKKRERPESGFHSYPAVQERMNF